MEREKRKEMSAGEKGGVVEEMKRRKKKKIKKEEEEKEAVTAAEVEEPSTEEVEEFYAILRRMDEALRYLKGKRVPERRTTTTGETAVAVENKELNLNEVPSDSSN